MEIADMLRLIVAVVVGTYLAVFVIIRRVNEWYFVGRLGDKKHSLPPGDMGWPLLGDMVTFFKAFKSTDPDSFINNLIHRYGKTGIYKTHLFWRPSIIVCTPETCRRILMDDERFELGYPPSTLKLSGEKAFHGISNAEHKRIRKLTTSPINGHEALAMYIGYTEDNVVAALEEWASMNRPIEFALEMRKAFFKAITLVFMGSSSESVLGQAAKLYAQVIDGFHSISINIPGFTYHKALKARTKLVKIVRAVLEERKEIRRNNQQESMMDLLMDLKDEDGRKLEDKYVVDLLLAFLIAGHETSSLAGTWATMYLYQHPEILKKAKEEQQEIIKRRPSNQKGLSLNEIRQMEYLRKVIDETLRVANLSFSEFRVANVDVKMNGYLIPKGWRVLVWGRAVHMDPENFPDPKEFNPSRWDSHELKAGAFIPFGAGSRICPGSDLAKLQVFIFLHYFLLNYKLEQLNPAGPAIYLPAPIPADNCLAKVTRLQ